MYRGSSEGEASGEGGVIWAFLLFLGVGKEGARNRWEREGAVSLASLAVAGEGAAGTRAHFSSVT